MIIHFIFPLQYQINYTYEWCVLAVIHNNTSFARCAQIHNNLSMALYFWSYAWFTSYTYTRLQTIFSARDKYRKRGWTPSLHYMNLITHAYSWWRHIKYKYLKISKNTLNVTTYPLQNIITTIRYTCEKRAKAKM